MKTNELCALRIREARRCKNFSQEYIAFELGISQKSYSEIESNKVRINLEMFSRICTILNLAQ